MPAEASAAAAAEVVVVGAGWAGLAAALRLRGAGLSVALLDQARAVGGRARDVDHRQGRLDIGQHLLLGAYRHSLRLLELAGLDPDRVFHRAELHLPVQASAAAGLSLRLPRGSGAAGRIWALLHGEVRVPGGRWALLGGALRTARAPAQDLTVQTWLERMGLPVEQRRLLWEPLCLAALNTPPASASAGLFAAVLRAVFAGPRGSSDLLLPRTTLGESVAEPLARRYVAAGGQLRLGVRVVGLAADAAGGLRLHLHGQGSIIARRVILAVPWFKAAGLLGVPAATRELAATLASWPFQAITTVYYGFAEPLSWQGPLLGLVEGPAQWVVDRRHCDQTGTIAAVISGNGPHLRLSAADLAERVAVQLAAQLPGWQRPSWHAVLRERRATFAATPAVEATRPTVRSPQPGLWLAGDYTDTGLPATLEGAAQSGLQAAQDLLDSL